MQKKLRIENGSEIVVVGGGPAGSLFAHFALRAAEKCGMDISVKILDRRSFSRSGQRGCNMCAGVISESLCEKLRGEDIVFPTTKVQQVIDGYYFQSQDYGLRLYNPEKSHVPHIMTVFRGGGPFNNYHDENISFDDYLLKNAEKQGAEIVNATVEEIDIQPGYDDHIDLVIVKDSVRSNIQADLVVGAFGLNTTIVKRIVGEGTRYRPPHSVRACNAELYLGASFIREQFNNKIYCLALGIGPVKFAAFTPKGEYITVTLIGKQDVTKAHLVRLLQHPVVVDLLPNNWKIPRNLCICFPKIPTTHAVNPFADRMVIIGDASISRFYKSGIESAFTTAQMAANTVFEYGVTKNAFKNHYYREARKTLGRDNFYGHIIYSINGIVTSRRDMVTPYLRYANDKRGAWAADRINDMLWGMVTGNIPYREIFFKFASLRFQFAMLPMTVTAISKTVRRLISDLSQFKQRKRLRILTKAGLGPLEDGNTVAIIGGGPAGASCAISLLSHAEVKGINIKVVLYEWKSFDDDTHNECAGVLSPPIKEIMESDLGVPFPDHLVESCIKGYYLHSDENVVKLDGGSHEVSYGVLRTRFDKYMLEQARSAGAEIIQSKVTDIEIEKYKATVYSESKHTRADVVVGAFGLEEGSGRILERESRYVTPRHLLTIMAKFHPATAMKYDKEYIHAFLPSLRDIEFGAVTPKEDHFAINIAGKNIHTHSMERFLHAKGTVAVLPEDFTQGIKTLDFHRGCFPISPAKNPIGDRYVTIGDAAGLIRPFKGKGVNSACLMGIKAADVMLNVGVSRFAFRDYYNHFSGIVKDIPYARIARRFVISASNNGYLNLILNLARRDKRVEKALFYSVAGTKSYKKIMVETISLSLSIKVGREIASWFYGKYFRTHDR